MAATTSMIDVISFYLQSVWFIWLSGTVLFGLITLWFWMERSDMKRYADDILIRKTCYKNKKTLGSITDMAGTKVEFVCDTDADHPGLTKHKTHTLVNPNLVSTKQRGRLPNGIPTLDYFLPYLFPSSIRSAAALIQTRDYVREHYPGLDWIEDDLDIIKLIFSNNKYLLEDCRQTVTAYMAMGVNVPDVHVDNIETNEEPDMFAPDGSALMLDTSSEVNDFDIDDEGDLEIHGEVDFYTDDDNEVNNGGQ